MASSVLARRLLFSVLIGANVLVLGLSVRFLYQSRLHYEEQAEAQTRNVTNALDQSVSASISRVDLALQAVADELERQLAGKGIDERLTLSLLKEYEHRLPEVEAFRVANADGLVIVGRGLRKEERPTWKDRDYFVRSRDHADAGLQVSPPLVGRVSKRYIISFSRRYNYPDGSFAGVVASPIPVDHFEGLLRQFEVGRNGTLILRYRDLSLITRVPPIPEMATGQVGNKAVSSELRQMVESGITSATYHLTNSPDGFERILTFHRLHAAPMVAIVGMASNDYLAEWRREIYKTAAFVAGFLLLSLLAWFMLRYLLVQGERRESQLQAAKQKFESLAHNHALLLQSMGEGMYGVDINGCVTFINPAALSMLGLREEEVLGKNAHASFHHHRADGSSYPQAECPVFLTLQDGEIRYYDDEWMRRKGGTGFPASMTVTPVAENGLRTGAVVVFQDISQRKAYEARIHELAFYDTLTRLPNRRLLFDRLGQALPASGRRDTYGALLFLDLDNFKALNDTRGHEFGDLLLVEVAQRLLATVRVEDTVARLGGDEFVVMLEDLGSQKVEAHQHAEVVAGKICEALGTVYVLQDTEYRCSSSIGFALFKGPHVSATELLRRADSAMYEAKSSGRNAVRAYREIGDVEDARAATDVA